MFVNKNFIQLGKKKREKPSNTWSDPKNVLHKEMCRKSSVLVLVHFPFLHSCDICELFSTGKWSLIFPTIFWRRSPYSRFTTIPPPLREFYTISTLKKKWEETFNTWSDSKNVLHKEMYRKSLVLVLVYFPFLYSCDIREFFATGKWSSIFPIIFWRLILFAIFAFYTPPRILYRQIFKKLFKFKWILKNMKE